jgi:y4mF family transcriptional regulator
MSMTTENHIASFVKYNRSKANMTQEELAEKAGVGLRFIRDLEQGKKTLRLDKVNQVLQLFGYTLSPGAQRKKDPYEILMNHFDKNVHVYLKNKTVLVGFIIDHIRDNNNEVSAWKFVSNNNAVEYRQTKNPSLVQTINHADIEDVENIVT